MGDHDDNDETANDGVSGSDNPEKNSTPTNNTASKKSDEKSSTKMVASKASSSGKSDGVKGTGGMDSKEASAKKTTDSSSKNKTASRSHKSTSKETRTEEGKKGDVSKSLWITGLSSKTRAVDLKELFAQYGKVIGAKVVTSAKAPGSQCFGYVTMASLGEASVCIEKLNKIVLHAKEIEVGKAKTDPTPSKVKPPSKSTSGNRKDEESGCSSHYTLKGTTSRSSHHDIRSNHRAHDKKKDSGRKHGEKSREKSGSKMTSEVRSSSKDASKDDKSTKTSETSTPTASKGYNKMMWSLLKMTTKKKRNQKQKKLTKLKKRRMPRHWIS